MILIPAIDIIDGKCVRLSQGDYSKKKIYGDDPLELAKMFEDWGVKRLHLVDLDGARAGKIINSVVLERICNNTKLVVDFGGGLKSDEDLRIAFESGAEMITGGSIAVKNPEMFISWLEKYGNDKIILGADHKEGKIAISGWEVESNLELMGFLEDYLQKGIKKSICTDISVDGMLKGPSTLLYAKMLNAFPGLELIASGGVGDASHLKELEKAGIKEVIVGKALYEKKISKKDLQEYLFD